MRAGFNLYAGNDDTWQFWTGTPTRNGWDVMRGGGTIASGQWTHVAAVFEPSEEPAFGHDVVGTKRLYIDGGQTIQSFLKADLIDEMIISQLPVLLGGGTPLFGDLATPLWFEHLSSEVMLGAITKHHYRRRRD